MPAKGTDADGAAVFKLIKFDLALSELNAKTIFSSVPLWTADSVALTARCRSRPTVWHGVGVEAVGRIVKKSLAPFLSRSVLRKKTT